MVDTPGADGEIEGIQKLSLAELIALDGFRGADPNEIFGVDFNGDFDALPPHARSYAGIGSALEGAPLDSWVRQGMHRDRLPEFSSFDQLTDGLSTEEKVRMLIILHQYLKDMAKRRPDFQTKIFESETLDRAEIWVNDMLRGIDADTMAAFIYMDIPGFETTIRPIVDTPPAEPVESGAEAVHAETEGRLKRWFRRFLS